MQPAVVIAEELNVSINQITKTIELLEEGSTIPFISRYRKDITGNLDEVQIRTIEERYNYIKELQDRKTVVIESITSQDKLTPELEKKIKDCLTKTELEDLYLPFKPKRRTRAMIAKERGLEPLADSIWEQMLDFSQIEELANKFVNLDTVVSCEMAIEGAKDILAERISENADVRAEVRKISFDNGFISSKAKSEWQEKTSKFDMYYDFKEKISTIPSHRLLAINRGVDEDILESSLGVPRDSILLYLEKTITKNAAYKELLFETIKDAYDRLLSSQIETDIRLELKERADSDAIKVFQANLRSILLAHPLGGRCVLAMDPGFRTGVKLAVINETGKYIANDVIYPVPPFEKIEESKKTLLKLIRLHKVEAIAIGNGTASRETESFVKEFLKQNSDLKVFSVVVSEAGASVYSASDVAREEYPDLDVTVRGAINIGHRLQDPLAALVKIDPKAIGVGQYQHDVNQKRLKKGLYDVVESAVNFVGVEVNTASAQLLKYVAGIGESLANSIISYRNENGPIKSRMDLRNIPRFGPKAFQQSAGFLRIRQCINPLDNSAVHPENYDLVEKIAKDLNLSIKELIASPEYIKKINYSDYISSDAGEYTIRDILEELKKPGRDPRESFEVVSFNPDITEVEHLQEGMVLEGVVTNVTDFGCFVDVGVHQDGLVHVSQLADKFVTDPKTVVQAGDKVTAKVLSVDLARKRISLTLKPSEVSNKPNQDKKVTNSENKGSEKHKNPSKEGDKKQILNNSASKSKTQNMPFNSAFSSLSKIKIDSKKN